MMVACNADGIASQARDVPGLDEERLPPDASRILTRSVEHSPVARHRAPKVRTTPTPPDQSRVYKPFELSNKPSVPRQHVRLGVPTGPRQHVRIRRAHRHSM
eukprot:6783632-Prymnesium_polylepis.1